LTVFSDGTVIKKRVRKCPKGYNKSTDEKLSPSLSDRYFYTKSRFKERHKANGAKFLKGARMAANDPKWKLEFNYEGNVYDFTTITGTNQVKLFPNKYHLNA
jgi:hypothetical protein